MRTLLNIKVESDYRIFSSTSMDDLIFFSSTLCVLLLLFFGFVRVFYAIWWKPKSLERRLNLQGIKGNGYKPVIGDIKEYMSLSTEASSKPINLDHRIVPRVDPFTINIVQKYGKISLCWLGTTPRVIIKDTELFKEILSDKSGAIVKPPLNSQILILTKGLTTLEGEEWARHRRLLNPAFHMEKLKGMIPLFSTSCTKMIEEWKRMKFDNGTREVDVWPEMQKLTLDVISRAAFGSNYKEGIKIFELQKELILLVLESMKTLHIPGFRFIPTKNSQMRKRLDKEITFLLNNIIRRKEDALRAGESMADDLLSLLLQSKHQHEGGADAKGNGMTLEEIVEECKQFYLAGQETVSCLLTWTIILLALDPEWQEKARDEVQLLCQNNEPDFPAATHFKTITMILNEVLRLYPPVIAQYQHTCKEIKIGDISLPAGVDITLPTLLIHHDPELWGEDADQFKPERFSAGVSTASKNQLAFFPFGWGPRNCIGQNFAMFEAKIALAMILQRFSFELSPSYAHAPHTVMTLQPQHGAQIILRQL